MRLRHPELGNTIPVPHECSDLCYFFCMRQFLVCLMFFASIAGILRAHASGASASLGSIRRRKNNAEENRRLTKI